MTIKELSAIFVTEKRKEALSALLNDKKAWRILLSGLEGSAPALLFSTLPKKKAPYLIVADDEEGANYLYNDLHNICGDDVLILPSSYKRGIRYGQLNPPAQILRTETLSALSAGKGRIVVASPEALAERVPLESSLSDSSLTLVSGTEVSLTDTIQKLRDFGFQQTDYVYEPGQFANRGSILDVYSYSNELPYRIDWFDTEIDSIRTFDIETQLSEERVAAATLVTALQSKEGKGVAFTEFIGKNAIVMVESYLHLLTRVKEITGESISKSVLISGDGNAEAMSELVDYAQFEKSLNSFKIVEYGYSPSGHELFKEEASMRFDCTPQAPYHKNFELISESFAKFISDGYSIFILSDSESQITRLKEIFRERGENIDFTPVDRTIHQGFVDHDLKLCVFTDHQIFDRFHKYYLKSDRARSGKLALSLKELNQIEPGDFIVHVDHGIGRFAGLVRTDTNGTPQEMIKLTYQNDDIILVSIHSLHKLSKYRGKDGVPPKINKLGSGAWNRLKERTKSKLKDIARDLIKLYAERLDKEGFSFSPDTYMQHELEASFIYEDTPDQQKAVAAIKNDMEARKPMDRLICGDVGFGKTEIAIRAAFKAAADNKQTAVLVPTTVLAMQHYHTFKERLKDFPVRVDFLSRARKPKEVKQIIADLKEGKIDILIGTHKIIGKDIKFKDLGLLVVDEEQKFGVGVKEKLKQLKVNVDTLTMSATPIPRTLQFSLMGARDLSSLNTPPSNRRPVATTVTPFNDDVIAEAINFEISRGGQAFIISNRIESLFELEDRLKRIVPGIRIAVGHGQLPAETLEKRILDFAAGLYDVLISTTIIENGIDMPNVNTILVNNAQNFGLSELHQLRGRVGRSDRKAFCYLLVPPGFPLTPIARRRLQAIESFSDLGAGIHIAMQDLDLRGAGNLLGAEQSGFIADLGYETYQKILRESVKEIKTEEFGDTFTDFAAGEEEEFTSDCNVESDRELRLPPSYVPQESERISLYQQLDNMERQEETEQFRANLRDRFGPIPKVTEELIQVVPLRKAACRLGIERLLLKGGKMYLYFVGEENKAYYQSKAFGRIVNYLQKNPLRVQIRRGAGKNSFLVSDVPDVFEALSILTEIESLSDA